MVSALAAVVSFFAFCSFLSFHPSVALSTRFTKGLARIAYDARQVPIQVLPDCTRYDARVTYLLRPGRCRFSETEFDTEINANSFGLRDDEASLTRPDI